MTDDEAGDTINPGEAQAAPEEGEPVPCEQERGEAVSRDPSGAIDIDAAHDRSS
jgi:hypothetical protein